MDNKRRIKYFDNIKGLLIFLVVFSHFLYEIRGNIILENIVKVIYIFHMPFFIFISGYFSKNNNSTNKDSLYRLLFYYIVGNTFLMWFSFIMYNTPFNLVEPYYSFWFLLALVFYRVIIKYVGNIKFIFPISIFVSLMIGGFSEVNNVFALSRIICFFPFFIMGYKLDKNYIKKFLDKRNIFNYICGAVILFSLFYCAIVFVSYIKMDDLLMYPYRNNIGIIYRSIILVMAFLIILGIMNIVPNKNIPFIRKWGEKSLYIFLYHRIIILMLVEFINKNESTLFYIMISLVLSFIICLIFSGDFIFRFTNDCYEKIKNIFKEKELTTSKVIVIEVILIVLVFTLIGPMLKGINSNKTIGVEEKISLNKNDYKIDSIKISKKDKSRVLYKKINKASSVCFIGDSISAGSRNGGYGWFIPLMNAFSNKKVINISKGGATVRSITKIYNKEKCDLYIIEIGTNDVRYRDRERCSMDEKEYIDDLEVLVNKIPNKSKKDFVFIAPWFSLDNDPWIQDVRKKNKLLNKYRKALKKYCLDNNYLYIDPNSRIEKTLKKDSPSKYLVDHIHPNASEGIYLYSRAVMDSSK